MIREVWRIELGVGVGPFRLGAGIAEVLHALKSRLPIRPFEIAYDAINPYKRDVILDSADDGFKLHFNPERQTLKFIEFYDLNRVALKFGRVVIFGGDISATFMSIYNLFGPTFPGHYDVVEKCYVLGYDGGCVKFPIPEEYRNLYQDCTDLPMEFPNGATPAATGLNIFVGEDYRYPGCPAQSKKHYFEEVEVDFGGTQILLTFSGRKQCFRLGCSPQEVVGKIGAPVSVFRKSEDPNDGATVAGGLVGEYFHNYPHLGLDILYSSMHRALKVILKTNATGHPDFGAYNKCHFRLNFRSLNTLQKSRVTPQTSLEITPEIPWEDINLVFKGASDLRPIVHDNGLGLHPFGSSLCYSPTPKCVFEVMKNGYIASVTLISST